MDIHLDILGFLWISIHWLAMDPRSRGVYLTRLPHLKCIRFGSVRSSLPILMHAGSIAIPYLRKSYDHGGPGPLFLYATVTLHTNVEFSRLLNINYRLFLKISFSLITVTWTWGSFLEIAKSRNRPLSVRGPQDSPDHSRIRTETSGSACHEGVTRMRTRRGEKKSWNTWLNESVHKWWRRTELEHWIRRPGWGWWAVMRRKFSGKAVK